MDKLIDKAIKIATEAHKDQKRWGGEPYITHPERVAANFGLDRPSECIVAWLHDVVEDTNITLKDLFKEGFPEYILDAIDSVSKRDGESYTDFIRRVAKNKIGLDVKMADLCDNLSAGIGPGSLKDKYELALVYLKCYKSMVYSDDTSEY